MYVQDNSFAHSSVSRRWDASVLSCHEYRMSYTFWMRSFLEHVSFILGKFLEVASVAVIDEVSIYAARTFPKVAVPVDRIPDFPSVPLVSDILRGDLVSLSGLVCVSLMCVTVECFLMCLFSGYGRCSSSFYLSILPTF